MIASRRRALIDGAISVALSLATVLACSASWGGEPKPFSAIITWSDGQVEVVNAQNYRLCSELTDKINSGLWKPVGRAGMRVNNLECRGGGVVPGGECDNRGRNCK